VPVRRDGRFFTHSNYLDRRKRCRRSGCHTPVLTSKPRS
jgi:hypothetical protein